MSRFGLIALGVFACIAVEAQPASLGLFEGQSDVGAVMQPGSAEFDGEAKSYTVSGSGENMWGSKDEFHFVWKQVSTPDIRFTANVAILGTGGEGHRKALLMIRQSLDGDSVYVDAARHGDGLTSLQFRSEKGGITREVESNISGPVKLRIEKQGNHFYMFVAGENEDLQFSGGSARVEMQIPFYVGIGVCAHKKDAMEKAVFTNVELRMRVAHPEATYSTVETVLVSGDARAGFVAAKQLKLASWSADGQSLTYEMDGKRQETPFTPLKTAAPVGPAIVVEKPAEPPPLPSDEFNNISPSLSPDGKYVVFLSYPKDPKDNEVMLRLMTVSDKTIKVLAVFTGGPDSLGPQPWSPDGRRVVFISYQSMR